MTKKHDELVEKMAKKIWAIHAFPRGETDWDRAVEQAKRLIALTLKAVVDGMPLEPWEVDRIRITLLGLRTIVTTENAFDWGKWCEKQCRKGANQFIALRPTGTGEEK